MIWQLDMTEKQSPLPGSLEGYMVGEQDNPFPSDPYFHASQLSPPLPFCCSPSSFLLVHSHTSQMPVYTSCLILSPPDCPRAPFPPTLLCAETACSACKCSPALGVRQGSSWVLILPNLGAPRHSGWARTGPSLFLSTPPACSPFSFSPHSAPSLIPPPSHRMPLPYRPSFFLHYSTDFSLSWFQFGEHVGLLGPRL